MPFLIRNYRSAQPALNKVSDQETQADQTTTDLLIPSAHHLLLCYVDCEEDSPIYAQLCEIRDYWLTHLSEVEHSTEVYGLIYWLLRDLGIDHRGEPLEDTVERLTELEIEVSGPDNRDLIYCLQAAVERIDELSLNE